jgi:hypothetical protein
MGGSVNPSTDQHWQQRLKVVRGQPSELNNGSDGGGKGEVQPPPLIGQAKKRRRRSVFGLTANKVT